MTIDEAHLILNVKKDAPMEAVLKVSRHERRCERSVEVWLFLL